jgi:hypothetical protein
MFEQNHRIARCLLFCTVALLSAGCATIQERSSLTSASALRNASDCPRYLLRYCVRSGHDTRCECVATRTLDAMLREQR